MVNLWGIGYDALERMGLLPTLLDMQHTTDALRMVDQAGRTMDDVVGAIQRVTALMADISTASSAQSVSVAEVDQAVKRMDETTQQNAALVEQSAAAATSLRQQADQLVAAVAVFKT